MNDNVNNHKEEGKKRLVLNVLTGWASQFVFIIVGFILPRFMDEYLGKELLGVWDFSWSIVNYISLTNLGVGSSTNRYIAKYKADDDVESVSKTVSSVFAVQLILALIVLILTACIVLFLPSIYEGDPNTAHTAKYVAGLLGLSVMTQMIFDSAKGVLTGYHRWDINNGINALSRMVTMTAMILVILLGFGLIEISLTYLLVSIAAEIVRFRMASKIAPEIIIKRKLISIKLAKEMVLFGLKSITANLPQLILLQSTNILVASTLGASSLAEFARPVALVRLSHSLINRYSFVLTPIAGSINTAKNNEEIVDLLFNASRWGVALSLPIIIFFVLLGNNLINIWMGEGYTGHNVLMILALGYFMLISQEPSLRILMGLNMHGRISIINMVLILALYGVGIASLSNAGMSLDDLAFILSIPMAIGYGLLIPAYTCFVLKVNPLKYFVSTFKLPLLIGIVICVFFYLLKIYIENDYLLIALAVVIGGPLVLLLYWMALIPDSYKRKVVQKIKNIFVKIAS